MKALLSLGLTVLLLGTATFNQPAPARMNNVDQSIVTDKYKQMKLADRIVVTSHSGTVKVLNEPSDIKTVVDFFEKHQFDWRQPILSNNAPSGTYALEFFLVEAPLVTVGMEKRNLNFRNNGESFKCSLKDFEMQELTNVLGIKAF